MKNPFGIRRLAAGIAVLAASGLTTQAQVVFTGQSQDPAGWKTVWYDHFDGASLNMDNWNIEVNGDGGGNQELQYYCPEGVSVRDGNLVLTAERRTANGRDFQSGRITTQKKVYFTHGKVEARIKMPKTARGLWPAFWMMGERGTWPANGEIDIVEMGHSDGWNVAGNDPENYLNGAYHWGTDYYHHAQHAMTQNEIKVQDGNYHIFTCEWTPDAIIMYLDGHQYCALTLNIGNDADPMSVDNYFHKPNFILFNLAVGGMFPGIQNPADITALPNAGSKAEMLVDWVRVSQPAGDDAYNFMEKSAPVEDTYEPDPDTKTGLWGSKAVDDNGDYTFDVNNAGDIVLISTTYGVTDMLKGMNKVLKNYNVDNTNHFLYVWEETYYDVNAANYNSFGFEEGNSISLAVSGAKTWSGAGFASAGAGKDLSMIDDSYVLHFAMRGGDKTVHATHTIQVGNAEFKIGRGSAIGDYPRDGEWYNFDIPVKVLHRLNPTLFDNPSGFVGNVFAFLSGGIPDTKIQLDNIFFYKSASPVIDVPETDTITETGKYASESLENGQATFDKANAYGYVPVQMSSSLYYEVKGANKIALDLQNGVGTEFFVWEKTYTAGSVDGLNSMGINDDYIALKVDTKEWSGAAFNIADGKNQNLSLITDPANNYWFHIAFKADDMLLHPTQTITIGNAKFTIGPSADSSVPSLGDYTRDGKWWNFDIPVRDLLVMAPTLWNGLDNFKGDIIILSSGGDPGRELNFDNVFFYRNDTKVIEDAKDTTPCGPYMSAALNGGQSTFDWSNADKIIPIHISDGVKALMNGKIRNGYDTSVTNPDFQIWEQTYVPGESYGSNSFGLTEDFTSLVINDKNWSGGGINITSAIDMSVLSNEENYYLHLAIKDADYVSHQTYGFELNGTKFTLGTSGDGYVTDFTRDGEWYYLDIPVNVIKEGLFANANAFSGNILTFNNGSRAGAKLEIDNVFFYVNLNPIAPEQPDKPAVEPKVTLRASSTSALVGSKVTLTATTTVPADVTVTKVEFFNGETSIATDEEAPYSCELTLTEAKTYAVKAVMTLSDGRTATSAEVKVTAKEDQATVTLGASPATVTEGETIALTANVHVPQGAEAANVVFYVNDQAVATDTEAPYTCDWTAAAVGTYAAKAVLTLSDGKTVTSTTVSLTVNAKPVDKLQNVPTPIHDADKVISVFSNKYENVTTFSIGDWGEYQTTSAELVSINGNDVYKLNNFNFVGWELPDGKHIDASGYTHMHVDYYTPDGASFAFTPVSPGPKENVKEVTPVKTGEWNSYDVALTEFPAVDLTDIFQIKFDQGGNKTGYIANVYFWKEDTTGPVDPKPVDPTDGTVIKFEKDSDGATNLLEGGYLSFSYNNDSEILTVIAHFDEVEKGLRTPGGVAMVRPGVTGDVNMTDLGNGSYQLDITGLKPGDSISGYAWYGIDGGRAQTPVISYTIPDGQGGDKPQPVNATYKGYTYIGNVQKHSDYVTVPYRVVKIVDGVETTLTAEEAAELDLNVYYAWNSNDEAQAAIALHDPEGIFYCTGLTPGVDYAIYEKFFIHGTHLTQGSTQLDGKGNFHVMIPETAGGDNEPAVYKSLTSGAIKPVNWDKEHADSKENPNQYITDTEGFEEGFIYWKRLEKGVVTCCTEQQFMNLHMYYWAEQLNDGRLRFTFTYVDVDGHSDDDAIMGHQHVGLVPAVHFYEELTDGTYKLITPDIDLARFHNEPLRCPDVFTPWEPENGLCPTTAADAARRAVRYNNDPAIEKQMTDLGYKTVRVETTKPYGETSANIAFNMQYASGGLTLSDISKLSGIDNEVSTGIFGLDLDPEGIYVIDGKLIAPEGSMVFNIHGVRVSDDNLAPGVYIVVCGNTATKVLVK